jgi:hypothetical protein
VIRYTFGYTPITIPPSAPFPNGQVVHRPYLITNLVAPSTAQTFVCYVWLDSGADQCVFPLSFAAALGLDPLKMPMHMTGGVGSAANSTYYAEIEIQIPINLTTPPISFTVFAGFTPGLEAKVSFDHTSKLFYVDA